MFDNIQQYISIFRCNFCVELIPIKGSHADLLKHKVYLVTENPRKYLKHYDVEESLYMSWVVSCSDCTEGGSMDEYLLYPTDRVIKMFSPVDAPTYDALKKLMLKWQVTPNLKSEIMLAAHFTGDKPVV